MMNQEKSNNNHDKLNKMLNPTTNHSIRQQLETGIELDVLYKSKGERRKYINNLRNSREIKKHITILGCGCLGRMLIYWLDYIYRDAKFTIIDKNNDKLKFIDVYRKHNPDSHIETKNIEITETNYKDQLNFIPVDSLLIDASYAISTVDILNFCNPRGITYLNSSAETWDSDNDNLNEIYEKTLSFRSGKLEKDKYNNMNALLSMGCNPGNVSLWAKLLIRLLHGKEIKATEWPSVSEQLGVQTIHISEHDTQVAPLQDSNEYANTWSEDPYSWLEEGEAPVEITLGTHENGGHDQNGPYILKENKGMFTYAKSYTPSGFYTGMLIRHAENITIGRFLSTPTYRPSVYYVYRPTENCYLYTYTYNEHSGHVPRLLTTEITNGADELGVSMFLKDGTSYWIGSLLDIEEAREMHPAYMYPYINATNIQVVAGYITGIFYLLDLPTKNGIVYPESVSLKYLDTCLAFQGRFIVKKMLFFEKFKNWKIEAFQCHELKKIEIK